MLQISDDRVPALLAVLESGFVFRKLGICYDLRSEPEAFPRPTLPQANETRAGKPDWTGRIGGLADCARNHGLLFDGYLLRVESGWSGGEEERIFDRLIGGLIRLATVGPKNYLIRGLTPDGRGFPGRTDADSHLYWAWAALRAHGTAAIALESQQKVANIAAKWMRRLKKDGFAIPPVHGSGPADEHLTVLDGESGPKLLALVAVALAITGAGEWATLLASLATENEGARLAPPPAELPIERLLALQVALHLLTQADPEKERRRVAREHMHAIAAAAEPHLDAFAGLDEAILGETPDLDWRSLPAGEEDGAGPVVPESWRRLEHERETAGRAVAAALCQLLVGEKRVAEPHAPVMARMLSETPWERLWSASALAPMLSVHGRGAEMGLWDERLQTYDPGGVAMPSLVARFLEDDYDDNHPEQAGHTESRKKPTQPAPDERGGDEGGGNKKRRRRRRRKKSKNKA